MKKIIMLSLLFSNLITTNSHALIGTLVRATIKSSIAISGAATIHLLHIHGIIQKEDQEGIFPAPTDDAQYYQRLKEISKEQWEKFKIKAQNQAQFLIVSVKHWEKLKSSFGFIKDDIKKIFETWTARRFPSRSKEQSPENGKEAEPNPFL